MTSRKTRKELGVFETVISPRSHTASLDHLLNEKSLMAHNKYHKKMELLSKMYEHQLFSPRTFENKMELLDSIQLKEYSEFNKQI